VGSTVGLLGDLTAIWGTLWVDVAILAILGFVWVSTWARNLLPGSSGHWPPRSWVSGSSC
jgi:hypothetical protein